MSTLTEVFLVTGRFQFNEVHGRKQCTYRKVFKTKEQAEEHMPEIIKAFTPHKGDMLTWVVERDLINIERLEVC